MHAELAPFGFTVVSVALDKDAEDARPWIEAARPTHPSLVDTDYRIADTLNIVNVPTVLWVDEDGRVVRPNDIAYATDTFRSLTGIDSARALAAVRAWVRDGVSAIGPDEAASLQSLPTPEHQLARAEFGLARWLAGRGRHDAAERHFGVAGGLAPHDFTIRRGSMPLRGVDSMGPEFAAMVADWVRAGHSYYTPLPK